MNNLNKKNNNYHKINEKKWVELFQDNITKIFSFICFFLSVDAIIKIFYFYQQFDALLFFLSSCIIFLYYGWKLFKN